MPLPVVVLGAVAAGWLVYKRRRAAASSIEEPPGDAGAPERWPELLARATRDGRWAEAARLHTRLAGLERGDQQVAHLLEAARIFEERLADADSAVRCYEDVLLVNPAESEAIAGLEFLRG